MANINLDWANLGFDYCAANKRYVAYYKDGAWDEGTLSSEENIVLHESACVLQYCQQVFEGLKAYRTKDGRVVTFRPELNGERLSSSATRLAMPPFPVERFVQAVKEVVLANLDYVPPYGTGATFYMRPFMMGTNPTIGVKPAEEFQFRIFGTPVGPYFKGGVKPAALKISDYDRAAPMGTGSIKAGLNYAMSLYPYILAHDDGFAENVYLDSKTGTYLEETGGANILLVDKQGKLVIPASKTDSILPSITRRSIVEITRDYLHREVEERPVRVDELGNFAECGLCGTAAVISPVGKIEDHGKEIAFASGMEEIGPILGEIYTTLTGMQMGELEAPAGWLYEIA